MKQYFVFRGHLFAPVRLGGRLIWKCRGCGVHRGEFARIDNLATCRGTDT